MYTQFTDKHEVGARSLKIDPAHISSGVAVLLQSRFSAHAVETQRLTRMYVLGVCWGGGEGCSHLIAPALRRTGNARTGNARSNGQFF